MQQTPIQWILGVRGSWECSNLSFMAFGHTNGEICNISCSDQNLQEIVN